MRRFNAKKGISVLLVTVISASTIPAAALAAEENTEKEEVVYVNIGYDGSVNEVNVVNIFDTGESGKIIDYGDYESTRNMTTTDAVHASGDRIEITTDAEKLYYEGKPGVPFPGYG